MTEQTPVGFDDLEFVDEEIEWPKVNRVEFDVITTVNDIENLAEGLDVLAATFGRYGIEGFTILVRDAEDPERQWVLKEGQLFTTEEFAAQFEHLVDQGVGEDYLSGEAGGPITDEQAEYLRSLDPEDLPTAKLSTEEQRAIREADAPVKADDGNPD